jgi:hypothetical protein
MERNFAALKAKKDEMVKKTTNVVSSVQTVAATA